MRTAEVLAGLVLALCVGSAAWQHPQPKSTPSPSPTPDAVTVPPASTTTVSASVIAKPGSEYQYPVGQTYVYKGVWRIFNSGTATLHMEQAGAENRVLGTATAASAAAVLYHVLDHYESFFDPGTFCSHSISRSLEEGLRRVQTDITFDYAHGKAVREQKNLKKKDTRHEEHNIPSCVTDVLTGIYYVGSLPLRPGQAYSFPLNDGGETINVTVHAEAREQIKTPAGIFNAIRVQPEAAAGFLKNKGHFWIWYSDDAVRVPVQARVHLAWGTLTFTLQRIDK